MGWRFRSIEFVFPLLLAVVGLLYAILLPPCQSPDENKHFLRAYHLSEGHTRPEPTEKGWVGGNLPNSVGRVANGFKYLRHDVKSKVDPATFHALASDPLDADHRRPTSFEGAESNLFVPYLPQAAAIALGRLAGLNPLGLHYAGRLANLVLAVVLVSLAIRITPIGKLLFGLVALLPLSVQQMASLSPDASLIAASFLLTALVLRVAFLEIPAGWRFVAGSAALAAWMTAAKITMAPLILLALGVPRKVLGSWLRYLVAVAVISAAVLLPVWAQLSTRGPSGPRSPRPKEDVPKYPPSPTQQQQIIREQPLKFPGVVANTCVHLGGMYIDHLFTLGWMDTRIPPAFAYPYLVALVVVALTAPAPAAPGRLRLAALVAVAACALALFLAFYIYYTAPGASIIYGIQGRYFIPILPLALVLLSNRWRPLRWNAQRVLTVALAAAVAESLVSLGTLVGRYYCPEPWPLWTVGGSAILAFVAIIAIWWRRRRTTSLPATAALAAPAVYPG